MKKCECEIVNGPAWKKTPSVIGAVFLGTSRCADGTYDLYATGKDDAGFIACVDENGDTVRHPYMKRVLLASGPLAEKDGFPTPQAQVAAIMADVMVPLWMLTENNRGQALCGTRFRSMGTVSPEGMSISELLAKPGTGDRLFNQEDGWEYVSHMASGGQETVFDVVDDEDGLSHAAIRFFPGPMYQEDDTPSRRDWTAMHKMPKSFLQWLDTAPGDLEERFAMDGGTVPDGYVRGDTPPGEDLQGFYLKRYAAYERDFLDKLEQSL